MILDFDTESKEQAVAACIIYAIYRSRNTDRFKISTKMWGQIANFSKLAAKKSTNIAEFAERFMRSMCCESINAVGLDNEKLMLEDGSIFEPSEESRKFLTSLVKGVNEKSVISTIINETAFIIMLVRERLESDKLASKMGDK